MSVELKLKTLTPAEIAEVTGGKLEIYNGCSADTVQKGLTTNSKEAAETVVRSVCDETGHPVKFLMRRAQNQYL